MGERLSRLVAAAILVFTCGLSVGCAPKVYPLNPGLYEAGRASPGERLTLEADGRFMYEHPAWGVTEGQWQLDRRELVLSAASQVAVEGYGHISPRVEEVPVQVLDPSGNTVEGHVFFYREGEIEERLTLVDGQVRVSRYLPFESVQVVPFLLPDGSQQGPMVEDARFHDPYAAYRLTVAMGRRFDEERWEVGKACLVRPKGQVARRMMWQEPEREILSLPPPAP